MSLYSALFSGVSALAAQSQSMAMIADNISNVNTIGYKSTKAAFSTLVTQTRSATTYSAGGVRSSPQALVNRQGLLQASASPTDLAISGNGFFVVHTANQPTPSNGNYLFTRAGSFSADADGYLRNPAGFYLQGWAMDTNGNIPANRVDLNILESVNVQSLVGTAEPTTLISMQANLWSSQPINPLVTSQPYAAGDMARPDTDPLQIIADFERSVQVVDSKGGTRDLTFSFLRADPAGAAGPNAWHVEAYVEPAADVDLPTHPNGLVSSGILKFNPDGTYNAAGTTMPTTLNITWATVLGLNPAALTVDLGTDGNADGVTQFDSASILVNTNVNGAVFGGLVGLSVNEDGIVTALFDNGERVNVFKLPLANFPNVNGLSNRTGNAYIATLDSGAFTLQEAGKGGSGNVAPSALEASTVELAEEFSSMIVTQRAFSAGAKIITTADEMLDELVRVLR